MLMSEFRNAMYVLGFDSPRLTTKDQSGEDTPLYTFANIKINRGDDQHPFATIKGRIPFEVAQRIHNNYQFELYDYRLGGIIGESEPFKYATCGQYKVFSKLAKSLIANKEELEQALLAKKIEIAKTTPEKLYIETCHIEKQEGLIIFMTEMQDYYMQKSLKDNSAAIQVPRQKELSAEVTKRTIENSSLEQSLDEWLIERGKECSSRDRWLTINNMPVVYPISKTPTNESDILIQGLLNKFDAAANPFADKPSPTYDLPSYLENVSIDIHSNSYSEMMRITDKTSKDVVTHSKSNKDIRYWLECNNKQKTGVVHTVEIECYGKKIDNLSLSSYDSEFGMIRRFNYNLTRGIFNVDGLDFTRPITPNDKEYVVVHLLDAIKLAQAITSHNSYYDANNNSKTLAKSIK